MKVSNCSLVRWFSSRGMCNLCSSGQELKHSEVLHHCELMAETCAASLPCSWHEALQKHPTETQSDKLSWPIAQREGPMRVRFSSTSSSHDLTPVLHHLAVLIQSVWASCTWCGQLRVMQWVKTFSENTSCLGSSPAFFWSGSLRAPHAGNPEIQLLSWGCAFCGRALLPS